MVLRIRYQPQKKGCHIYTFLLYSLSDANNRLEYRTRLHISSLIYISEYRNNWLCHFQGEIYMKKWLIPGWGVAAEGGQREGSADSFRDPARQHMCTSYSACIPLPCYCTCTQMCTCYSTFAHKFLPVERLRDDWLCNSALL